MICMGGFCERPQGDKILNGGFCMAIFGGKAGSG